MAGKLRLLWSVALLIGFVNANAQQEEGDVFSRLANTSQGNGKIIIIQDAGIQELVRNHVEQNKRSTGIEGFRIQLYSGSGGNSKKEAQDIKGQAMSAFPNLKVYLTYTAPFWRVRAGNFRNKSEALKTYYELKQVFPNCYPVRDNSIRMSDT
jgi:hypothetical protein